MFLRGGGAHARTRTPLGPAGGGAPVQSESAVRVGRPSRPSESAIRVGHPSRSSESAIRVGHPSRGPARAPIAALAAAVLRRWDAAAAAAVQDYTAAGEACEEKRGGWDHTMISGGGRRARGRCSWTT